MSIGTNAHDILGSAARIAPADTIEELNFYVEGNPAPQGSKRHVGNGRMIEMSKTLPAWRRTLVAGALEVLAGRDGFDRDEPLSCSLTFYMERGKSVRRAQPTVVPDIDKLERAVFDAMTTAGVWGDDAQVVAGHRAKRYADECPPGVRIVIRSAA